MIIIGLVQFDFHGDFFRGAKTSAEENYVIRRSNVKRLIHLRVSTLSVFSHSVSAPLAPRDLQKFVIYISPYPTVLSLVFLVSLRAPVHRFWHRPLVSGRHSQGPPFPEAAIPSVRRYIHNAYATPYERSPY